MEGVTYFLIGMLVGAIICYKFFEKEIKKGRFIIEKNK